MFVPLWLEILSGSGFDEKHVFCFLHWVIIRQIIVLDVQIAVLLNAVCVCVFLAPEHETSRCSALMSQSCLFGSGSSHSCWSEHIRLLFMFTQDEWDRCVLFCITVLLTNVCRVDESDWMLVLGADTDVIQLPDIGLMPPFHVQNPKLRLLHTKSVFLSTKIVACLKVNTTSCCVNHVYSEFFGSFSWCACAVHVCSWLRRSASRCSGSIDQQRIGGLLF